MKIKQVKTMANCRGTNPSFKIGDDVILSGVFIKVAGTVVDHDHPAPSVHLYIVRTEDGTELGCCEFELSPALEIGSNTSITEGEKNEHRKNVL